MADVTLLDAVSKVAEPVNNLTVPLASSAGQSLKDLWDLVFGGFGAFVEKRRIKRIKDIEDFKAALFEAVDAIPEDHLQEPPISIVGPALEASKYYYEEAEIRDMFANLIASSMDTARSPMVHPSFSKIIEQLSPLDARNLFYFSNIHNSLPIAEYRLKLHGNSGYVLQQTNVFLSNPETTNIVAQANSISALERVGLVNVSYVNYITNPSIYDPFTHTALYEALMAECKARETGEIELQKGCVSLTPLGQAFRQICFSS